MAEYAYPRWFFSNRSDDIRGLFCEYCERLGIRWTQSNPRNISVSHRNERGAARLVRAGEVVSRLLAVGADGVRGGWAVACLYEAGTQLRLLGDIGEIARLRADSAAPVAIDVPTPRCALSLRASGRGTPRPRA